MGSQLNICKASQKTVEKYKKILKDNGIYDEIGEILIEENPEAVKGAGMTGAPSYVTVKFADRTVQDLQLFVKAHPSEQAHGGLYKTMKLSEKECRFFTEYIPAVAGFCKSKGLEELINIYPKCYYGDSEMLIFENLVAGKGYFLLNKKKRQGLESSRIALTTLAFHHAISYAFIKEVCGDAATFFQKFPNLNYESFEHNVLISFLEPLVENGIATNIKILEKNDVPGKERAIEILKAHIGKGYEMLMNTIRHRAENEKILTLNHGDYWNNNMMFLKDEETGGFRSPVIFDFQCTRYNSPALDIGNFMYTSMKPEVRRNHCEELLKVYLETFLETVKKLGSPVELSYDDFFQICRRKFIYGFWFAIWLAADAGYAVINDVDENAAEEWSVQFDKAVQKWIEENPEKSLEDAKGLVKLMKEYENLL